MEIAEGEAQSIEKQVAWLRDALDEGIGYMLKHRHSNQSKATAVKLGTIALSGLGAILLGIDIAGYDPLLRNLAFIAITIVTLVSALESFFNYRSRWIEHEAAMGEFYKVRNDLNFYLAGKDADEIDPQQIQEFYQAFRDVWSSHNQAKLNYRRADAPASLLQT